MPTLRRLYQARSGTPLGSINDPSTPLYQALSGIADGVAVGVGGSVAGLPGLNYETSIRVTAVYRAVQIIAGTIGALPFHLYEETSDGTKLRLSPASKLRSLEDDPHPDLLPNVFWETSIAHVLLAGNCYWRVLVDGLGNPRQLVPIEPKRVQCGRAEDGRKYYLVDGRDAYADYRPGEGGEIVHIPGFSLDGVKGVSVVRQHQMALQLVRGAEEYGANIYANASTPLGVLESDADLDADQIEKLRSFWEKFHRGPRNSGRIAVLDNGAKYKPVQMNLADLQFLELRKFQVSEIARMFGIPNYLLFDQEKTSSWGSGIEEQGRNMLTFTFGQWIARFEGAVSKRVLAAFPGVYGKFELGGLLRADLLKRYQSYHLGRNAGILSVNDIMALEDMPQVEGGDSRLQPLNMTTLGQEDLPMQEKVAMVKNLIQAGFAPEAALLFVGLDPIAHLGVVPVTVYQPDVNPLPVDGS